MATSSPGLPPPAPHGPAPPPPTPMPKPPPPVHLHLLHQPHMVPPHRPQCPGPLTWFTSIFSSTGLRWSGPTSYPNAQAPGSGQYNEHIMALTRINLLTGHYGACSLLAPNLESSLRLLSSPRFDLPLILFDRSFLSDSSIYIHSTGNNPNTHPQWRPEYFDTAFPRRPPHRYRFWIINASNAPFIVDFTRLTDSSDPIDEINTWVMKFVIGQREVGPSWRELHST